MSQEILPENRKIIKPEITTESPDSVLLESGGWLEKGLEQEKSWFEKFTGRARKAAKMFSIISMLAMGSEWTGKEKSQQFEDFEEISFVKENPRLILSYIKDYKDKPWFGGVLRDAIRKLGQSRPELVLDAAEHFQNMPWASEELKTIVQDLLSSSRFQQAQWRVILKNAIKLKDYPWARDEVKKAIDLALNIDRRGYLEVLAYPLPYQGEAWLSERLEIAVEMVIKTDLSNVVKYYPNYRRESWGPAKFKQAAELLLKRMPHTVLEAAESYEKELWGPDLKKRAFEASFKQNPVTTFELTKVYLKESWGKDKLKNVAEESLLRDPTTSVRLAPVYRQEVWGGDFLKRAVEASFRKSEFGSLVEYADKYKHESWGPEKFKEAAFAGVERSPGDILFFSPIYLNESWGNEVFNRAMDKTIETLPAMALNFFEKSEEITKNLARPKLKKIVERILETKPFYAVRYADLYKNESWGKDYFRRAVDLAVVSQPGEVIRFAEKILSETWGEEKVRQAFEESLKKDLDLVFREIKSYLGPNWGKEILRQAVKLAMENDPRLVIRYFPEYGRFYASGTLEAALKNSPTTILRLFEAEKPVLEALKSNQDPAIKKILEIKMSEYTEDLKEKMLWLLDDTVKNNLGLREIARAVDDRSELLESLIRIRARGKHLAKFSVERGIKDLALREVQKINELHERPDAIRFKSIEGMGAKELYTLMVYGEEEIFTSSFNGLFTRLLSKMKVEKITGADLLGSVGKNKFRAFVKLAASFNRLNEFLDTMKAEDRKSFLENFAKGIDKERDSLSQAVTVADIVGSIRDQDIIKIFQTVIKEEYERVERSKEPEAKALYGLLAGLFGKKAVVDEIWIKEMAEKYKLPNVLEISSQDLVNPDGTNVQQYFFYNDEDGRVSFRSFLSQYKDGANWEIFQTKDYVMIKSVGGKRKIEIYANKPDRESEGAAEIKTLLSQRKLNSIVVVHRGHSYHVQRTIENIPAVAKIVHLGSCGGYNNISEVLRRAPRVSIISTKGIGTMIVNDPLLKMLNEELRTGEDLRWQDFWAKAEKRFGDKRDFTDYVPPHKNLGVLFLKAYHELKKI